MPSVIFALIALLGWGGGDVGGVVSSRRLGTFRASMWIYMWLLAFLTILIPFNPIRVDILFGTPSILSALLGLLSLTSYLAFIESVKTGAATVVGTIFGSFPALVVLLSSLFLHEGVTVKQGASIVAIMLGLMLTLLNPHILVGTRLRFDRSIGLALMSVLGIGFYWTFVTIPVRQLGPFWPNYIQAVVGCVVLTAYSRGKNIRIRKNELKGMWAAASGAIIGGVGSVAYNAGVAHGNTAIVASISGAYPIVFVLISLLLFKEAISKMQIVGMTITCIGIGALSAVPAS